MATALVGNWLGMSRSGLVGVIVSNSAQYASLVPKATGIQNNLVNGLKSPRKAT